MRSVLRNERVFMPLAAVSAAAAWGVTYPLGTGLLATLVAVAAFVAFFLGLARAIVHVRAGRNRMP